MYECTAVHLHDFLQRYGWKYRFRRGVWTTGWRGRDRSFPLFIRLSETFVHLETRLEATDWDVLQLNPQLKLYKMVQSDAGSVSLIGDFLRSGFDFENFSVCIGILGYYCDRLPDHPSCFPEGY